MTRACRVLGKQGMAKALGKSAQPELRVSYRNTSGNSKRPDGSLSVHQRNSTREIPAYCSLGFAGMDVAGRGDRRQPVRERGGIAVGSARIAGGRFEDPVALRRVHAKFLESGLIGKVDWQRAPDGLVQTNGCATSLP